MPSTSEILQLEIENNDRIYLYLEGVFWKAYQHSAYQFLLHFGTYKVAKRYVKKVKQEVVSLGFPNGAFNKLFSSNTEVHTVSDRLMYVCVENIDKKVYEEWFNAVSLQVTGTTPHSLVKAPVQYGQELNDAKSNECIVIEELRAFRLEAATPMHCMNFVHKLKLLLD